MAVERKKSMCDGNSFGQSLRSYSMKRAFLPEQKQQQRARPRDFKQCGEKRVAVLHVLVESREASGLLRIAQIQSFQRLPVIT